MRTALLLLLLGVLPAQGASVYEGYSDDRAALRKTYQVGNPPLDASSGRAIEAARRLFSKVPFIGMTRQEVLSTLGDPRTISDYGIAVASSPDSPLVYRFDSGYGGYQFTLHFRDRRVTKLVEDGLE